jgi:Nitroreductase family
VSSNVQGEVQPSDESPGGSATTQVSSPLALTSQQVLDVLRAAHRAPSIHNTQPWLLRPLADGIEVLEDDRRALPGSDPYGRDRLISCGAAVRNAEVAIARLGRAPETTLMPDGPDGATIARVTGGPAAAVTTDLEAQHRAIWDRRTHRRIFMATSGADDVPPSVHRAVVGTGVRLELLPAHRRGRFGQLLWEAAQRQVEDDAWRAELLQWTRHDTTAADGVPARSHGNAPFPVDGLLIRSLPPGQSPPPWLTESLASGPVVVLVTDADARGDWVRAGLALEGVLLAATVEGLVASFLNQVVQQDSCRPRLVELLGVEGHPQAVLRVGEPLVDVPVTPRRPLTDVTLGWPQG